MSKKVPSEEELARPEEYPEALNFEGLVLKANYRIIAYREDMLHAFEKKDAAAILYHIVYRWLEYKRDEILKEMEQRRKTGLAPLTNEEIEERMWIYMSYNDFSRETGGAVTYNTVVRTLDYLIETKQVIERRENHNPKFTEYEYRINKEAVRKLLKGLSLYPSYVAKGAKGKKNMLTQPHLGPGHLAPNGAGAPQSWAGGQPQMGLGHPKVGQGAPPNGGTSQKQTQNPSQDLSQISSQQQESTDQFDVDQTAATADYIDLESLTEEEIHLIQAYRQGSLKVNPPPPEEIGGTADVAPESEQAVMEITQAEELSTPPPSVASTTSFSEVPVTEESTPVSAALTDEAIVAHWEGLRGSPYGKRERGGQLRAAKALREMELPVPLSLDLLQQVYQTYLDEFWKQKYGELHLSHLIDTERSSGQVRVIRWLHRLRFQSLPSSSKPKETGQSATGTAKKVYMTEEEAAILAQKAVEDGKQHGYEIQAEAALSKSIENAWVVLVTWADIDISEIRTAKQWDRELSEILEILQMEAKQRERVQHGKAR